MCFAALLILNGSAMTFSVYVEWLWVSAGLCRDSLLAVDITQSTATSCCRSCLLPLNELRQLRQGLEVPRSLHTNLISVC